MTNVDFFITEGDTLPLLSTQLTDTTGAPIDLTSATDVTFKMAPEGSDTLAVNAAGSIVSPPEDGNVQYAWAEDDTSVPGAYRGVFVVSYAGGGEQTYPSDDFIRLLVKPALTSLNPDPVQTICSVTDVKTITNRDVDGSTLNIAWSVVEGVTGRPAYELLTSLGGEDDVLTERDAYWLKSAVAWQAAWVYDNPDTFSSYDVSSMSQSGQSAVFASDGLIVAPMARRCLKWVTWTKSRSVKIQRPFPYARLLNPTVTDDLGSPWNRTGY